MLVIRQRIAARPEWQAELELTYDARSKSRLRCFSSSGEDVGLFLERGQPPLADGECLLAADGRVVRVRARPEQLLHVTCASAFELTRAAYHLGNRHVALQVGDGWLRLLDDYVLKDMLLQLGPGRTHRGPSSRSMVPTVAAIIIPTPARRSSVTHRACTSSAYARERGGRARPGLGSAPAGQPAAADRRLQLFPGAGDGGGERPGERPG